MQSFAMAMVKEEATVFRVRHVNTLTMSIPTTNFSEFWSFDLFHHLLGILKLLIMIQPFP